MSLSKPLELDVILLAAGLSTRMGARNKMLLPFRRKPLIRHVAEQLIGAEIGRLHVVTGYEAGRVAEALTGLDLNIVFNPDFETGQMSSVSAGVASLGAAADAGVMIALGDMPYLTADDYQRVADAFRTDGGQKIAVPFFHEERGNPIIISRRFLSEIIEGELNAGCRKLVARRPNDILRVEVTNPAFIYDIDTTEDFDRATAAVVPPLTGRNPKGVELGTQG